ncbi:ATP-binding protein [Nocardioides seonyuensis]|uniref:ATP-binding protein n=1 Tax=Nocardioides seonyuensis TaxID=2518371 RepID=A0A4P7IAV8_9ACTN|nr:YifB family Mg chelatase-like AAA ATPase [Nocardioides seonyuensis]QBX54164.1 ATP-binding protein [Nocardioides seonyuensis]
MAFATAHTMALRGAEGHLIDVQVDVSPGLVGTTLVGRADKSLSEARDRVRMAINNNCGSWPATKRVTILLAPADLPKSGTHLDLAIALAVKAADTDPKGAVPFGPDLLAGSLFIGELSVSGGLRPVQGVLPMVMAAASHGITRVFVPEPQAHEAALVPGVTVFGMRSLAQVVAQLQGEEVPDAPPVASPSASRLASWRGEDRMSELDFVDLDGLAEVRYAVEVAAAGGHPVMLMGPRGSGKTSVAERIPSILPDLTVEQSLEVSALHSVAGTLQGRGLVRRPPWFAPHHGASGASVLGGGSGRVRPGQVSLAHHGVLFLDEFAHFRADVVEALRQPLESGEVTIARGEESATYPARSLVVLAANPCPCGNYYAGGGALLDPCECPETARRHYGRKLSGPVVDRVDIWMEVAPQGAHHGRDPLRPPEPSAAIRARVARAREVQAQRYSGRSWQLNSAVPGPVLTREWPVVPSAQALMDEALSTGEITRRGLTRVHRLAWTVADCDGVEQPGDDEVRTALALRATDAVHPLPARILRRAS